MLPYVKPPTAGTASAPGKMSFKDILMNGVSEQDQAKVIKGETTVSVSSTTQSEVSNTTTNPVQEEKEEHSLKEVGEATAIVNAEEGGPHINTLVLDAGPLLSQTFSDLQGQSARFVTTPAVLHTEVRDARARANVALWQTTGALSVRQPTKAQVSAVTDFARRTGDFAVLSTNDIHILALAREMDVELHGGSDAHLRKVPGGKVAAKQAQKDKELANANFTAPVTYNIPIQRVRPGQDDNDEEEKEKEKKQNNTNEQEQENDTNDDDGWSVVEAKPKKNRRHFKKFDHEEKREENKKEEEAEAELLTSKMNNLNITTSIEDDDDEEDETGWITQENIGETMRKDQYEPDESSFLALTKNQNKKKNNTQNEQNSQNEEEQEKGSQDEKKFKGEGETELTKEQEDERRFLPVAVSTGDFAMQNVALQMGLNLVSPVDGKYIKQVKSHMLRCHACFHLCPVPRTSDVDEIMRRRRKGGNSTGDLDLLNAQKEAAGNQKLANMSVSSSVLGRGLNFCPKCGASNTLRRCTVRVDAKDGHIHVFLKRNMQWSKRGNIYQLPATQSRAARQLKRNKDPYNFNGRNGEQVQLILREDQKEYERALVHDWKLKRENEKILDEWVGNSVGSGSDVSAGSLSVPFAYHRDAARHTGIKIGSGGRVGGGGNGGGSNSRRKK